MPQPTTYHTLEEIASRKASLEGDLHKEQERIGATWRELTAPKPSDSKGELIANLVSNSITAIDGFLLVRKLLKSYGHLFGRKRR